MLGILVHGDNHFIVRGPRPSKQQALELARFWSLITIGRMTPEHLTQWQISTKEFRENLEWGIVVETDKETQAAVATLLDEMRARGVHILNAAAEEWA